tara:strand:+ start:255 stop:449 length:195 start_codon:yes stop_codon:yes gene_type:complete
MKLYDVKCSLSGSCDDVHAIFNWSTQAPNASTASQQAVDAWKDEIFTNFKVLEVAEKEETHERF